MGGRRSKNLVHDESAVKVAQKYHKERKRRATSLVDIKPKPIPLRLLLPTIQMKEANIAYTRTNNINIGIISFMNKLSRNIVSKSQYCLSDKTVRSHSKLNVMLDRIDQIETENHHLACRILKTKSLTDTGLSSLDIMEDKSEFKIPIKTLAKYKSIILPQDAEMLEALLRPKIYLDIAIKDLRPVGRLMVQLFTEACPDVVLELVHYCTYRKLDKLNIIRIFPSLWLEAELQCRSGSPLKNPAFEHQLNVQSHLHPGVFSFSSDFLGGFQHGLINFSVSFRPLHVAHGSRVAFGLVSKNQRVIDVLQDYGTKNGVCKKDIVVVNCGRMD